MEQESPIFGPPAGAGDFEVLPGAGDLGGVTAFHKSFFPLFVHVTKSLPDLAVAPTLRHLLPGVFEVALIAEGETRSVPTSKTRRIIEMRFMSKKLLRLIMI